MGRIYINMDYKGRRKLKVSGHKDGWIYGPIYHDRHGRSYQCVRRMPKKSEHQLTDDQQVETNDFQRVMELHHALKDAYQGLFEGKGKSYSRFISANRKAGAGHIVISKGSLPTLQYKIKSLTPDPSPEEGGESFNVEMEYVEEDWLPGDVLRRVSANINGTDYFALIHIRPTEDGWLCSSQEMVEVQDCQEVIEIAEPEQEAILNDFIGTLCLMKLLGKARSSGISSMHTDFGMTGSSG